MGESTGGDDLTSCDGRGLGSELGAGLSGVGGSSLTTILLYLSLMPLRDNGTAGVALLT